MIKFYPKLENLSTKEYGQNKRKIKSIKKQENFFSVHHKARSSETRNKYTARKQSRSLLKMKTMNLNCSWDFSDKI